MENNQLFASRTEAVPGIRRDLQIIPLNDNGKELLYFHDSMGYLTENFALDANVQPLLTMFTGETSVEQIYREIDGSIGADQLLEFVQLLDQHRALYSDYFRQYSNRIESEFEEHQSRPAALAGLSYPNDPAELEAFMSEVLQPGESEFKKDMNALFAPHIEISVGKKQYGEAFNHLNHIKPKRVVILATSHYADYYFKYYDGYPFIGSLKSFSLPGRTISTDLELIRALEQNSPENGFTLRDRAHRVEHSIEFHLLFASAIWEHDFQIVPVLVSGFDELFYHQTGELTNKVDKFSTQLKSLIDGNTFLLISGDLSHVGEKFGDQETANEQRPAVEESDKQFLDLSVNGNPDQLLKHVKKDYDSTRICGFPPLYTYLKMFPGKKGELLNYFWWDEKERNSAVSFGSILY